MHTPSDFDEQYGPGLHNKLVRYYFYLNSGLNVLNQFRNLFLAIIGLYIALKLDHWWILPLMFIPSLLILLLVGWYATHHMNKVMDWLNVRFASHYSITQFNIQQNMLDTLKEIRDKLPK